MPEAQDMPREGSVFKPHHKTHVLYPYLGFLRNKDWNSNDNILLPIDNAENRYEPGPLIEDRAVIVHAGRDIHAETSIYSISTATYDRPLQDLKNTVDNRNAMDDSEITSPAVMVQHMRAIATCNSKTRLKVFTYEAMHGFEIEIIRNTVLRAHTEAGSDIIAFKPMRYTMTLKKFDAINCHDVWIENIRDAIHRRIDLAVRHVRHRLEEHQPEGFDFRDQNPAAWKAKRRPVFELMEKSVVSATVGNIRALDMEDRICHTCGNDFEHCVPSGQPDESEEPDHTPFVLACCSKKICRYCYINWSATKGAADARCPHCRKSFFSGKQVQILTYGLSGRSYYSQLFGNHRFTSFENFERTCADLDKELAENSGVELYFDSCLTLKVWQHIVDGALKEEASSTPLHLQPARSPVYAEHFAAALPRILQKYNGMLLPLEIVYDRLCQDLMQQYLLAYLQAEMHLHQGLCRQALLRLSQEPTAQRLGLPPDFCDFIERTLSRTLQFCVLRKCDDTDSEVDLRVDIQQRCIERKPKGQIRSYPIESEDQTLTSVPHSEEGSDSKEEPDSAYDLDDGEYGESMETN